MEKALVFAIEEFSTFDGPGIRTTVFLKGCPLRCSWCHNPEGQSFENQPIKSSAGCIGCGSCIKAGGGEINEKSIDACPNALIRMCAKEYTSQELCEKLEGNFDILNMSDGGITFSGGEPLSNHAFLAECLERLKGRVHTAVQTSGYAPKSVFNGILPLADYFLFDIKLVDANLHMRYTGVDNSSILENFRTLCASGKDFITRVPLIPGVTDTRENLEAVARLVKSCGVDCVELMPYNAAAGGKYPAVGRVYMPDFDESAVVNGDAVRIFDGYGIRAAIL